MTSKMLKMACLSQNSHVNTWDMVLKAILNLLGQAYTQMLKMSLNAHVNIWDMVLKAILNLLGQAYTKLGGLVEKN